MDSGAAEAAETVDAVLQGLLDDTQQVAALQPGTSFVHQQQTPQILPEPQQADSADQAPQALLAGSASSQLSVPPAATAPEPSPHMSPVISALNPLFLSAQSSRPQSAQLQQTLSAMSDQLSALEESMQQFPEDGAASNPARPPSEQSAEIKAMADLSQQPGEDKFVNTSAAGSDSHAVLLPGVSNPSDAATVSAASTFTSDALPGQPMESVHDSTLQSAPLSPDTAATAVGTLPTAGDQPVAYTETLSTAAADSTTSEPRAVWAPSLPVIPAAHRIAPRPLALFRHSISAMSHAAHSAHSQPHDAPGLDSHYISALHRSPKLDGAWLRTVYPSAPRKDAEVWGSNSREGIVRRPATARPARSLTALHQVLTEQPSRPQTAAAADRVCPGVRVLHGQAQLRGTPEDFQGSAELPLSPVRERMKNAVERESCLRLEAEMAALDVGELLHHKLAAEAAAQAEADRSASLANQLAQLQEELRAARQDASHQHVRELKLDLRTAQLASAALQKQLAEAEEEAQAEYERRQATEQALEAQRRAAEYARSRPTSPFQDPSLQSELASLRQQMAEMTGRLQQAEQANGILLAQIAAKQPLDSSNAAVSASCQSAQPSSQHPNAAEELVANTNTNNAEQQSSGNGSKHGSVSSTSSGSEQHPAASGSGSSPSGDDQRRCTDRQTSSSVSCLASMQKCLAGLAETLAQDAVRLQKVVEAQLVSEPQGSHRPFNWGFPEHEAGATPGPSRPVTASPYDSSHRPNRQWSASSARHESQKQAAGHQHLQSHDRTAGNDRGCFQGGDRALYNGAARRPGGRHRRGHLESSWQDPVPPSRMPEEILRQAREDYLVEKNRVRDKRLQELAAIDNTDAAVTAW